MKPQVKNLSIAKKKKGEKEGLQARFDLQV
jgi:hypothetical protein